MGSRAGTLPGYARDGRTTISGPLQGAYFPLSWGTRAVLASGTHIFRWEAPMDLRLLEVSIHTENVTSTPTFLLQHNNVDVVTVLNWPADDTTTVLTIVKAQRDISKGNDIELTVVLAGGEGLVSPTALMTYYTRGHINADDVND